MTEEQPSVPLFARSRSTPGWAEYKRPAGRIIEREISWVEPHLMVRESS